MQTLSGRFAAILIATGALWIAGCQNPSIASTDQAKQFVHTLLVRPDDTGALNALSGGNADRIEKKLLADVSTKVELAYLQARCRQGVSPRLKTTYKAGVDRHHAITIVHIIPADSSEDVLTLQVTLVKTGLKWIVSDVEPVTAAAPPPAIPNS